MKDGSIFIAIKGAKADGHTFVEEAFANGAKLAVVEDADCLKGKPGVVVNDTRATLSMLASQLYSDPSKELSIIGVTGTNGKTTTHWMIDHLLSLLGKASVRIGTIGVHAPSFSSEAALTTPDPIELHRLFRKAKDTGCEYGVMEVSSHSLDQKRVEDVSFDVAVFSNLSRDHLDYHETMLEYAEAKAKLFTLLAKKGKGPKAAVIHSTSDWGEWFEKRALSEGCNVITYGDRENCHLWIRSFEQSISGSDVVFHYQGKDFEVETSFIGRYNVENLASAILSVVSLGFGLEEVLGVLPKIPQVPGRLESCGNAEIGTYVDYAHTPDALQNALEALRPISNGRLWAVFGCGGDRDKGKRPQMAGIASTFADRVVITSDNPRTENPNVIIADILAEGIKPFLVEPDRERAIMKTLSSAKPGDVILIAGKGHENYQIIGTTKSYFSDQGIVRKFFKDNP